MTRYRYGLALAAGCMALAGCGGGGVGTVALPPTGTTFALSAAVSALETSGMQRTASVSGNATVSGVQYPVSGSVTLTLAPISAPTIFNGQSALLSSGAYGGSVTIGGQSIALNETAQAYLSTQFEPLGYVTSGAYCVAPTPGVVPASVALGDAATVVDYQCYADAAMAAPSGTESLSYAIKPGVSSTTVTVALTTRFLDAGGQQTGLEEDDYLLDTAGVLTLRSASLAGTFSGIAMTLQLAF